MDNSKDVREFLVSRRAKMEYYTRLERVNLGGVSDAVLDALGTALQLDEAERTHLIDLARTDSASKTPRRERRPATRPARLEPKG